MTERRRAGAVAVGWLVLAGAAALHAVPALGTVRLVGVGLLWAYGLAVGPLLAGLAVAWAGALRPPSVAAWISPALILALGSAVHHGGTDAPTLVLLAALAPVLAATRGAAPPPPDPVVGTVAVAAVLLVAWAGVATAADVARALGGPAWLGGLVALALAGAAWRFLPERLCARALTAGVGVLALAVAVMSALCGLPPWRAWLQAASRPSVVLSPSSPAVDPGLEISEPVVLRVGEPHRVTAPREARWRVREHDGERRIEREWQLRPGQALVLRPGDELELPVGSRVRFEAGRRVPGGPPTGVAWADRVTRHGLVAALAVGGAALALAGGVALLTDPASRGGFWARALSGGLVPVVAWLAAAWGVTSALVAPELGLGAPPSAPLVRLPVTLASAPWDRALRGALLLALGGLWAASARALGARLEGWLGAGTPGARGARMAAAAAVATLLGFLGAPASPGELLLLGSGLAATVCAPALVGNGGRAHRSGSVAALAVYAGAVAATGEGWSWGSATLATPLGVLAGVGVTAALRPRRFATRGPRAGRQLVAPGEHPLRE